MVDDYNPVAKPEHIMFLCRALTRGGAERQLIYTARGLSERGYQVTVVTFYSPDETWYPHDGINLVSLNKKSRWDIFHFLGNFIRLVKSTRPQVIYSYLNLPNIIASTTKAIHKIPVVCGVRSSDMDLNEYSKFEKILDRIEKRAFQRTDLIICNSFAGQNHLVEQVPSLEAKATVIPNGFDFNQITQKINSRNAFRKKIGVLDTEILIGHVGRYDPMKDIPTFIKAAKLVKEKIPHARFICWGYGDTGYTNRIKKIATETGVDIIWHSSPQDVVYSAFDLYVLSSISEGHSNTLTEAMAHGLPCVATNVGDTQIILDDFGRTVEPANPQALAEEIISRCQELKSPQPTINQKQIDFIKKRYGTNTLIDKTEKAILSMFW